MVNGGQMPILIIVLVHRSLTITLPCMSCSTNTTQLSQRTLDFRQKFKTEKCRYWYQRGFCPFNQLCAFAHNDQELRDKHQINQQYKTRICANFKNLGYCRYGDRCQFQHVHEAPTVLGRPHPPQRPPSHTYSDTASCNSEPEEDRHQKKLKLLNNFGLDLLSIRKGVRSDRWREFLMNGEDPYEEETFRLSDFEREFPDYDFKRKPRLGSM